MDDLPTVELLEAAHTFPGPYLFKAIGRNEDGFVARVLAVVREELRFDADPAHTVRETPAGRHISVTLEVVVSTPHQVIAVYRGLRALAGLVLLL